ncbi:hypothetical protein D5S17_35840 [Pseudonocardiaceae bacterium YIM PH 21723]|nr:hypothetical protein D5S17_35840 [Pseudonocardiaceae bacterium YIM PH 21723]
MMLRHISELLPVTPLASAVIDRAEHRAKSDLGAVVAVKVVRELIDDLNGNTEDVKTVHFFDPLTGQKRRMELGKVNRGVMQEYFTMLDEHSRPAEDEDFAADGAVRRGRRIVSRSDPEQNRAIREFALRHPHLVPDCKISSMGRIPERWRKAFNEFQVPSGPRQAVQAPAFQTGGDGPRHLAMA